VAEQIAAWIDSVERQTVLSRSVGDTVGLLSDPVSVEHGISRFVTEYLPLPIDSVEYEIALVYVFPPSPTIDFRTRPVLVALAALNVAQVYLGAAVVQFGVKDKPVNVALDTPEAARVVLPPQIQALDLQDKPVTVKLVLPEPTTIILPAY
jgi:hypothetical protein